VVAAVDPFARQGAVGSGAVLAAHAPFAGSAAIRSLALEGACEVMCVEVKWKGTHRVSHGMARMRARTVKADDRPAAGSSEHGMASVQGRQSKYR
jgi:hypothetical protein